MTRRTTGLRIGISAIAIVSALALGCGDDGAGNGGSGGVAGVGGSAAGGGSGGMPALLGPSGFGTVMTDRGSTLTWRQPDGTVESIGADNVLGWVNGQLLGGDYLKQLRIATAIGAMELRLSFPGDTSPDGLIEALHDLRASRLSLEDTGSLDSLQVEIWFSASDPPFSPSTNALGTVELFLDVQNGFAIYEIVGEVDLSLQGDGGTHVIEGIFWLRDAAP